MSARVVRDFMPETTKSILSNPWLRDLWFHVFPRSVEQACPTPSVSIPLLLSDSVIRVKWPNLAITCILGIALGLGAGGHLLRYSSGRRGFFVWGWALVWYAMMCVGGLIYHSFEPLTAFYVTDVVSTGCSSMACLLGLLFYQYKVNDTLLKWRLGIVAIFTTVVGIGLFAPQLIREQVYLAPTFLALVVGFLYVAKSLIVAFIEGRLIRDLTRESSLLWFLLSAISAVLAAVSLPYDSQLCAALGPNGGSFLPWAFLGCDLFFFCAYKFAVQMDIEQARIVKSSKSF